MLLTAVSIFCLTGVETMASHFRGGTISWSPTGNTREVQFKVKWFQQGGTLPVGQSFSVGITFGDGTVGTAIGAITANNPAEDWFTAEMSVKHVYPVGGPYTAFVGSCCRLSPPQFYPNGGGLNNSSDQNIRLETIVRPTDGNSSPTSSLPAIVTVGRSANAGFAIPVSDIDRDTIRFRLATIAEKGSGSNTQPPGLSVDPTTGIVTWNNFSLGTTGFWTTQIVMEDLDSNGNVMSKTPLDFMLKIQQTVGTAPTLTINPTGPLSVRPNTPISFTVTGNDADPNARVTLNNGGLPPGMTVSGAPMNAALTPPATSTFTWTPTLAQAGSYTISFTATDDTFQQALGSISIFVESNAPPSVTCPAPVTLNSTAPVSVQVQDADADPLTVTWTVDGNVVQTDSVSGNASTTTLTLTYPFSLGTHTVMVTASDGVSTTTSCSTTVTVVNSAPVASDDQYTVNEDAPLTVAPPGVLSNDVDAENNPLTASLVSGPTKGALNLNADGSFTYTPNANFNGPDSFTYKANDGSADAAPATVTITIKPVNDAPTANTDDKSTNEDQALTFPAGDLTTNDTDADGDGLTVTAVTPTADTHGAVTLGGSSAPISINFSNFPGTDQVLGTGDDQLITPVQVQGDFVISNTDPTRSFAFLSGGTGVSFDSLSFKDANQNPRGGTIVLNGFDTPRDRVMISDADGVDGGGSSYSYSKMRMKFVVSGSASTLKPVAQAAVTVIEVSPSGQPTVTFRDANGAALHTVAVANSNYAPQTVTFDDSANGSRIAMIDVTTTFSVATTALTFTPAGAGGPGSITYTPEANHNGPASFEYTTSDGHGGTATGTVNVTVNPVNDAPVAVAESYSTDEDTTLNMPAPGVLANDTDVEGSPLAAVPVATPEHGALTLNADGSFVYAPAANYNGPDSFTYKANDGGLDSNVVTVSLTVNSVNDAPTLGAVGAKTVDEMTALSFNATADDNADNPKPNNLTFSIDAAAQDLGASITTAGQFSWTPSEAQGPGTYNITVKVTDDGNSPLSDEETISVTVHEINRQPSLAAIAGQTSVWGSLVQFTAAGSDPDVPANTLTFGLVGAPAGASINPSSGAFNWTPAADQIGPHIFKVRVTDDGATRGASDLLFAEQTVTINVTKRPTKLVYTGDSSEQYSDQQALSATLTDKQTGAPLAGKPVGFTLGAQTAGATTDGAGVAANGLVLTQNPAGMCNVVSSFAGDAAYEPSGDSDAFDITQEDARAYYSGALYAATSSTSSSSATVTLAATIKDITAVTGDPATDAFAGDIRKATVTFINRDNNTTLASNVPIGLVSQGDATVGAATANVTLNIGSNDSQQFTIGIIVNDHHTRNVSDDNTVVTVSKPIPGLVTGGGYLLMSSSGGQYPGEAGTKNNFGFNVKLDSKTRSPKGNINIIVRNGGRVYQLKGNAMTSLAIDNAVTTGHPFPTAVFNGKANIQDITNPLAPMPIDGNATLQVVMTDKGEPGAADSIAITLWDKNGGLWFASNWNSTKTIEQTLGGGNLQIR
jgi:VCBS repeat-containing protein